MTEVHQEMKEILYLEEVLMDINSLTVKDQKHLEEGKQIDHLIGDPGDNGSLGGGRYPSGRGPPGGRPPGPPGGGPPSPPGPPGNSGPPGN